MGTLGGQAEGVTPDNFRPGVYGKAADCLVCLLMQGSQVFTRPPNPKIGKVQGNA